MLSQEELKNGYSMEGNIGPNDFEEEVIEMPANALERVGMYLMQ
jgi:hypothetical protein